MRPQPECQIRQQGRIRQVRPAAIRLYPGGKGYPGAPLAQFLAPGQGIEAKAAAGENMAIKLGGQVETQKNVEGDGTVLRKMYVSSNNEH